MSPSPRIFKLLLVLIFMIGACWCLEDLGSRGLEYDEIWTLQHYASKTPRVIFTDLSKPNNHPLHSLLMKASIAVFGGSSVAVRLPVLLAGLSVIVVAPLLALLVWHDRTAALLAAAFCAGNGGLIHYSQTARGYSIQSLLVLLVAAGIVLLEQRRAEWSGKAKAMAAGGICLAAILSVLTLPTSILFLVPLFGLHGILLLRQHFSRDDRDRLVQALRRYSEVFAAYLALGAFCLTWYIAHRHQFAAGKAQFGTPLSSLPVWLGFCRTTLLELCAPWLLAPMFGLLLVRDGRRQWSAFACVIGFPLLASVVTSAGPARVYLPLIPFIALAAGGGMATILRRLPWPPRFLAGLAMLFGAIAVATAPMSVREWTPLDWKVAYPAIRAAFPHAYLCFPAGEGYPLRYNNFPKAIIDTMQTTPDADHVIFVQVGPAGQISGIDRETGGERYISTNAAARVVTVADTACSIYRLVKLSPGQMPAPGKTVLLSIPTFETEVVVDVVRAFRTRHPKAWITLNGFLYDNLRDQQGNPVSARLLATDDFPLDADTVVRIAKFAECPILLYVIEDAAGE